MLKKPCESLLTNKAQSTKKPSECTVITCSLSPYQLWQAELCYYSFCKVRQAGDFLCLIAANPSESKPSLSFPHEYFLPTSPHPKTGDSYTPYNKPGLLYQWLPNCMYSIIHLIDPDCIFLEPIKYKAGRPLAHTMWFMSPHNDKSRYILENYCRVDRNLCQPLAIPLSIQTEDLTLVVERWLDSTRQLRTDSKCGEMWPWVEEMWGYVIACAEYGLVHDTAVRQCLTEENFLKPILHYSYTFSFGAFQWDKRSYRAWDRVYPPEGLPLAAKYLFSLINEYSNIKGKHK